MSVICITLIKLAHIALIAYQCVRLRACRRTDFKNIDQIQSFEVYIRSRWQNLISNITPTLAVSWLRQLVTASQRGGPGSCPGQSMWDLWWIKWQWDSLFLWVVRFPRPYHSTVAFHAHITPGRWTIGPLGAAVQRQSFTPRRKKNKRRCLECSIHACGRIYILYQSWCADHSGRSV
jgi:hypothetical protein